MSEINVTKDNFETEVLKASGPVLVDFWAAWCGPCKMLAPVIKEIADEHPEIKVCKVNIDEEEELAEKYQIFSIPTVAVFKDGNVANKSVGYQPKEQILGLI